MPQNRQKRKNTKRNYKNRPRRGRQNAENGQSRPTLVLKAHIMLDATINTSVSLVRQINITPFLGLFPTALQQSKFYQQYRIRRVRYLVLPTQQVNTNTTSALFSVPLCYSVPLYNSSIPAASESGYLAFKNVNISVLNSLKQGSFVPFVPTSQQTTQAQVMVKSPKISTKQTNPLHFGHSFLFVEQSNTGFCFNRVMVQCQFEFFHFDGQKANGSVESQYDDLREAMYDQIAPDLHSDKASQTKPFPVEKFPWKVVGQPKSGMSVEQFQQMLAQAEEKHSQVWKTPKLIRK